MKKAFTLAEVLITLGIIGVVAALTMPSLIANHKKRETVVKLKKVYSILQQGIKRAEVDYGQVDEWDFTLNSTAFYEKYVKPYFNVAQEFIGVSLPLDVSYKTLGGADGNAYGKYSDSGTPKIILNDGTLIAPARGTTSGIISFIFMVDINGYKKPNQFGKDMFFFDIKIPEGIVVPYTRGSAGVPDPFNYTRDDLIGQCQQRSSSTGLTCAALIMMDGWEIKDDYPWAN